MEDRRRAGLGPDLHRGAGEGRYQGAGCRSLRQNASRNVLIPAVSVQRDGDRGLLEGFPLSVRAEVPEAGGVPGQPEAPSSGGAGASGAAAGGGTSAKSGKTGRIHTNVNLTSQFKKWRDKHLF